jgi:PST family polysaccharide transporter
MSRKQIATYGLVVIGDARLDKTEPMGSISTANTEHLRTDHLVQNLGKHAISGGFFTVVAQGAKFILNLTSAVVLARLLSPKEFGLVGMVLAVTGLLGIFKELGLSTATVQRETITQEQVSNLFWLNVALGGVVCFIGIGLAPLVAWFYHDSRLTGIMVLLSFTFLLTGSTVQHQALLIRQMRFRAIAIIEVMSMLAGIVTACCLALFGFAYWSLVGQQLCLAAAGLVLTWWASGWRPTMPKRHSGVAPLLSFGAHLTVSDLVGRLAVSSDSILIGRLFGAEPLGLYNRAAVLLARPLEQVLTPLSAILIPVLSRLQSDPERYRRTFLRAYDTLALITLPLAALCLVLAEPLVLFVLGPQWKGAVPLFAGFTLVAVSLPQSLAPAWLLTSQGRGLDLLHTYLVAGAVTVGAYLVGLPWGPLGMVLALAATSLMIRLPILYHLAGRRGPVSSADLWKSFFSHLPCWGAAYAAATMVRTPVAHAAPLVQLLVCVPFGFGAAAGVALALQRPRANALYAWNTLRNSLARQSSGAA